jgi:hypothetical protein
MRKPRDRTEDWLTVATVVVTLLFAVASVMQIREMLG